MPKGPKKEYQLNAPSPAPVDLSKFKAITLPPYVNMMSLSEGHVITGKVMEIVNGMAGKGKAAKKTQSLKLQNGNSVQLMPVSAVIKRSLEMALGTVEKVKGREIAIKVLAPRKSPTFKREYFNCEIFLKD